MTSARPHARARLGAAALAALLSSPAGALAQTVAPTSADLAMSCQQLADGVAKQNAFLKQQNDYQNDLNSKPADPGDADPQVLIRVSQIKSAKAKARADGMVAAGRQKGCFR